MLVLGRSVFRQLANSFMRPTRHIYSSSSLSLRYPAWSQSLATLHQPQKLVAANPVWTPAEDAIIRKSLAIPDESLGIQLAVEGLPHRTLGGIQARRKGLRRKVRKVEPWTLEEQEKLQSLLNQGLRPSEIRPHFEGRTMVSIARRCYIDHSSLKGGEKQSKSGTHARRQADIRDEEESHYKPIRRRSWTKDEIDQIQREIDGRLKKKKRGQTPSSTPEALAQSDIIASLMRDPGWQRGVEMTRERVKTMMADKTGKEKPIFQSRQRTSPTGWTMEEQYRATEAVADQIGQAYQPRLSFQGEYSEAVNDGVDTKPYLTPSTPALDRIDWQAVADKVKTRSLHGCERWFYDVQSLRRKGTWRPEELDRLEKGIARFGSDAMALSKYVGTRSPKQCAGKLWEEGKVKS